MYIIISKESNFKTKTSGNKRQRARERNIDEKLKFIYSEKAMKFCVISNVNLSYVVLVKSTVEILQNFVAFSEYVNFNKPRLMKKKKVWPR